MAKNKPVNAEPWNGVRLYDEDVQKRYPQTISNHANRKELTTAINECVDTKGASLELIEWKKQFIPVLRVMHWKVAYYEMHTDRLSEQLQRYHEYEQKESELDIQVIQSVLWEKFKQRSLNTLWEVMEAYRKDGGEHFDYKTVAMVIKVMSRC